LCYKCDIAFLAADDRFLFGFVCASLTYAPEPAAPRVPVGLNMSITLVLTNLFNAAMTKPSNNNPPGGDQPRNDEDTTDEEPQDG
jgi:hypothetical protein